MSTDVLTNAQQLEIKELEEQALVDMTKLTPTYPLTMAKAVNSGEIWTILDVIFEQLQQAGEKMPEEFTLSISSDVPAEVDAAATAYLATDLFRPRGGWSLFAKKRALRRELRDKMDRRALLAALHLRRARMFLAVPNSSRQ